MSPRPHATTPSAPLGALLAALGVALGLAGACGKSAFECSDDPSCKNGDLAGVCEPEGYCSFPDTVCPSGRRFGEHADDGLADKCVADDDSGDTNATQPTGPGVDAYGPCLDATDCEIAGSACVTNGTNRMCAPPCTTSATPSPECPATVDGDTEHVGCLYTDMAMTTLRCFAICDAETSCPDGMLCAEPVCSWMTP